MRWLIINADDYGYSPGIGTAIRECCERGVVTRTSIMANQPCFEREMALLPREGVGWGVHLNLTAGEPITGAGGLENILDGRGRFVGVRRLAWRLARRRVLDNGRQQQLGCYVRIREELAAQIERVARFGVPISHLDGHEHVHLLPGIRQIVVKLAREAGIAFIRIPAEWAPVTAWPGGGVAKIASIRCYARRLRQLAACAGVGYHDAFFGLSGMKRADQGPYLQSVLDHLPPGTSELMVHPGRADPTLPDDALETHRSRQTAALLDPAFRRAIEREQIALVR